MSEEQKIPMSKFFTLEKAAVPTRVYLSDPETGERTKEWLDIRSGLSQEFRDARAANDRKLAMFAATNPSEESRKNFVTEALMEIHVSLVAGWSFPEPCNAANVREFLKECPQVVDLVSSVADDTRRFFGSGQNN